MRGMDGYEKYSAPTSCEFQINQQEKTGLGAIGVKAAIGNAAIKNPLPPVKKTRSITSSKRK